MTETLRYFFSASFQGFAALITLGSMFYLYVIEKINSEKNNIIKKVDNAITTRSAQVKAYISQYGVIEYVRNEILAKKPKDHVGTLHLRYLINKFDHLIEKEKELKNNLPTLLNLSLLLLSSSMISLFAVGYNIYFDYFLLFVGFLVIILSLIFFIKLKYFITVAINS